MEPLSPPSVIAPAPTPVTTHRLAGTVSPAEAISRLERAMVEAAGASRAEPTLVRVVQPVTAVEPLRWLDARATWPRVFWAGRDEREDAAGVGSLLPQRFERFPSPAELFPSDPGDDALRTIVTAPFDAPPGPHRDGEGWDGFDGVRVHLPELELRRVDDRHFLIYQQRLGPSTDRHRLAPRLAELASERARADRALEDLQLTDPRAAHTGWIDEVERALSLVRSGALKKLVLARQQRYRGSVRLDGVRLMIRLHDVHRATFRFVIEPEPGRAFLGASPERLFRRHRSDVESEAVAGTRPRGHTVIDDRRLAEALLADDKDRREHDLVVRHIDAGLRSVCDRVEALPGLDVIRLANVQHLRTRFRGSLAPGVDDRDIVAALHPTPATCGWPLADSRSALVELERFPRGLYAGVVARMSGEETECAVALRCGIVDGETLTLYAGAGLVAGSDAHAEWEETETKLNAFRCVVNPRHD